MRLGVFGGTFDPVHIGHLLAADQARELLRLDKVLFVVAGRPWLKADRPVTEAHHRAKMVEVAVGDNPYFESSSMELEREGPTYTVDTLEEIAVRSAAELYLIVGADAVSELDRWHRPSRVLQLATIAVVTRPGTVGQLPSSLEAFGQCVDVRGPLVGVSATDVRARIRSGRTIRYMVQEAVEEYIVANGLYRDG